MKLLFNNTNRSPHPSLLPKGEGIPPFYLRDLSAPIGMEDW
jgi:hypothetical protein